MPTPIDALLVRLIGSLEAKQKAIEEAIQALRVLRSHADLFAPEKVKELLQSILGQPEKASRSAEPSLFSSDEPSCEAIEAEEEAKEEEARTYYARIVAYFLSVDNKDSTTAEIRQATGLTRSALSAVLYRTHRKFFLRSTRPEYERMMLWRMELVAYEAARQMQGSERRSQPLQEGKEVRRGMEQPDAALHHAKSLA